MEERIVNKLDSGMPRWLIEVGFLLMLVQAAATEILSLAFALALPLVLLPLGISITFFYRGTLQWVGILMIAHMITMIVFPIMLDALLPAIVTDCIAIIVLVAYAWAMRKVLV